VTVASQACPGSCNARLRRITAGGGEVPEDLFPVPGEPVFCQRDAASVRRELAELDDLASIAAAASDGHRGSPERQRVGGTPRTASPSPAADDLDDLASVLRGWESAIRGEDPVPRRGYLATEITTVTAWLVAHFDQLITHPDIAEEFAGEVRQWHQRLAATTKAGTGRHQKARPCPRCDRYSLFWVEGNDYVECGTPSCGRLMGLQDYELWEEAYPHMEDTQAS
jgi:glutathione S-transferase